MIEKLWSIFDNASVYAEIFLFIAAPVAAFFAGKHAKSRERRMLTKIVGFRKNADCEVMLPVWSGNLEFSHEDAAEYAEKYNRPVAVHEYVHRQEADSLLLIQKILDKIGTGSSLLRKATTARDLKQANNKFFCGGPLGNVYLKHIFADADESPFSFRRRMYFGSKRLWVERKQNEPFRDIQKIIPDDTRGHVLFIEKTPEEGGGEYRIPLPESYMCLIRYRGESREHGTFFIAFGNSAEASENAVRCLLEDTRDVYRLTKKHPKRFFYLIPCPREGSYNIHPDRVTGPEIFSETEGGTAKPGVIIDLTDAMFGRK